MGTREGAGCQVRAGDLLKVTLGNFVKCFYWFKSIFFFGHAAGGTVSGAKSKYLPDPHAGKEHFKTLALWPKERAVASVERVPLQLRN